MLTFLRGILISAGDNNAVLVNVMLVTGLLLLQPDVRLVKSIPRTMNTRQDACRPNAFTFCELPVITSLSEDVYPAFPGEEFHLFCQAFGSPAPTITWYRILPLNGESIDIPTAPDSGGHIVNDDGTLRIKHVVPHDEGKYFCLASNAVGESKFLIDIKVSHPMVSLIPLKLGSTFVTLTWNGSVAIKRDDGKAAHSSTHSSLRHHHHIEARYRLSRHLLLKYRPFKEDNAALLHSPATTTIKLTPTARQHTIINLLPSTAYEFCIEFQPKQRPTTLLDCLILRTVSDDEAELSDGSSRSRLGYHHGQTLLFLLLILIVGTFSSICFGCYAYAIGRKLWKYRNKKGGFSSLGYGNDAADEFDCDFDYSRHHYQHRDPAGHYDNDAFYDENPRKPLIARI